MTGPMTGDEYMQLLLDRQALQRTRNPLAPAPLLEAMVRPGDEYLFTPPPEPVAVRPARRARSFVPAAELRARRAVLVERARALEAPVLPEVAAARGVGVGRRRGAAVVAAQDRRLAAWSALQVRIGRLEGRVRSAEAREARVEPDPA